MRHPFSVRKQSSGYTASVKWIVVKNPGARRVSVHAIPSRPVAQYEADTLNVNEMVKDYDEDPRPYDVRKAEAEAAYYAESNTPLHPFRPGNGKTEYTDVCQVCNHHVSEHQS